MSKCQEKDISRLVYRQSSGGYSQQPKRISHPMELTPFNDFQKQKKKTDKQTQMVSAFKVPKGETKVSLSFLILTWVFFRQIFGLIDPQQGSSGYVD